LTEVTTDVRELTVTGLGPEGLEARLTLADETLVVEAAAEAPLPEWLRGELPFEGLDVVYVDPAKEHKGEEGAEGEDKEEEEEEERLKPGFRVARLIEVKSEETGESFPRTASLIVDEAHVDLQQAEAFAATFARLAGREKPEEAPVEEAPTAEAGPSVAVEAAPPAPEPETPAFAGPSDEEAGEPEDKAFV
jgi:hypothetical protein